MTQITNPCPRCLGGVPNNQTPGAYAGAKSRADGRTEICSGCGQDEARRQAVSGRVIPVAAWPVSDPHAFLIGGAA